MELIVVRHALPRRVVNRDGTAADPDLDDLGRAQAAAVAGWLADEAEGPIHSVYSSPLRRAVQTAEPIAAALGLHVAVADGLAEWDRESAEYIPVEELRASKDERWTALLEGNWDAAVTPEVFQARVVAAMEEIIAAHRGQRVVAVCHGGVVNSYASALIGASGRAGFFHPEYTSISRFLAAGSGERNLRSLNEIAHLRGRALLPR